MQEFEVILVPGGGLRENGEVPPWTKERLDLAVRISGQVPIVTLSAGTVHKPPPLDKRGFPIFESVAAAHYLIKKGIAAKRILIETCSYDTIGNAFFSRVIHVDPRNFRKILIITSEFHLTRTQKIFEWVFSMDNPGAIYRLQFLSAPDVGISPNAIRARLDKEHRSLSQFLETSKTIKKLEQLHQWLFSEHACYTVSRKPGIETGEILETY